MAKALAVRIQEEGIEGANYWLQVRTFFTPDNGLSEVDGVRFFFAQDATLVQIRNACQNAIIAQALAKYGMTLQPNDLILPSFQRGA